jgi:hypothetical protein
MRRPKCRIEREEETAVGRNGAATGRADTVTVHSADDGKTWGSRERRHAQLNAPQLNATRMLSATARVAMIRTTPYNSS